MAEKKSRNPPGNNEKFSTYKPPDETHMRNEGPLKSLLAITRELKRLGDLLQANDSSWRVHIDDFRKNTDAILQKHVENGGLVVDDLKDIIAQFKEAADEQRELVGAEDSSLGGLRRAVETMTEKLKGYGKSANAHIEAMSRLSSDVSQAVGELKGEVSKIVSITETPLGRSSAGEQKRLTSPAVALRNSHETILIGRVDSLQQTIEGVQTSIGTSSQNVVKRFVAGNQTIKTDMLNALEEMKREILEKLEDRPPSSRTPVSVEKSSPKDGEATGLKQKVANLTQKNSELATIIEAKDQEIANLKAKPKTLRVDASPDDRFQRLKEEYEGLRTQNKAQQTRLKELEEEKEIQESRIKALEDENTELKEQLEVKDKQIARLEEPKPAAVDDSAEAEVEAPKKKKKRQDGEKKSRTNDDE